MPITAHVTIDGDEVIADLTESAPMVRGSLNSTRSFVEACVYQAVRCALTIEVPNTAGAFRPVHVLTKPGTVAEVVMPGSLVDAGRDRLPGARRASTARSRS